MSSLITTDRTRSLSDSLLSDVFRVASELGAEVGLVCPMKIDKSAIHQKSMEIRGFVKFHRMYEPNFRSRL